MQSVEYKTIECEFRCFSSDLVSALQRNVSSWHEVHPRAFARAVPDGNHPPLQDRKPFRSLWSRGPSRTQRTSYSSEVRRPASQPRSQETRAPRVTCVCLSVSLSRAGCPPGSSEEDLRQASRPPSMPPHPSATPLRRVADNRTLHSRLPRRQRSPLCARVSTRPQFPCAQTNLISHPATSCARRFLRITGRLRRCSSCVAVAAPAWHAHSFATR